MSAENDKRTCQFCGRALDATRERFCSRSCKCKASAAMWQDWSLIARRFWGKVDRNGSTPSHVPGLGPCWTWSGYRDKNGYGTLSVAVADGEDRSRRQLAHRVSWRLEHGQWPTRLVLHKCDNPACVRPDHLFEGTDADNMLDCTVKGRRRPARGESHGKAKLKETDILDVLRLRVRGETQAAIAARYGVRSGSISSILRGEHWKYVTREILARDPSLRAAMKGQRA